MIYPELEYQDDIHQYKIKGVIQPSVTQALSVISDYAGIPKAILKKAADRGTAVHKATELADDGTLDWASLDDELIPYVMAWEQFKHDMRDRIQIISSEKKTFHPALLYAGTLDREMVIDDKRGVLDLKSSVALMPSVGPQLSAYLEAENAHRKDKSTHMKSRWGLRLGKDGKYELKTYKDPADKNTFISCLTIVRFFQQHKKGYSFLDKD